MTKEDLIFYGFREGEGRKVKVFNNIPMYPEEITTRELAKECHMSGDKLFSILQAFPCNAPVAEEGKYWTRIK